MKKTLLLILLFTLGKPCFSTEWGWYYVYVQQDYMQGPWSRTNILGLAGTSYTYLHPVQCEDLFGSGNDELAAAILKHLKKETPKRYVFRYDFTVSKDTVLITAKEAVKDFEAVKNELVASFTLNSYAAVRITQPGQAKLYTLKDVSLPYMDLVFPGHTPEEAAPVKSSAAAAGAEENPAPIHTVVEVPDEAADRQPSMWLAASILLNMVLITILIRKMKQRQ